MNQIKNAASIMGRRSAAKLTKAERTARASRAGKAGGRDRYYISREPEGLLYMCRESDWARYYIEDGKIWCRSGFDTPSKRAALKRWLQKEGK